MRRNEELAGFICMLMLLVALTASEALGAFGGIIEVAQPLADAEGIYVSRVSYSRNYIPTLRVPGYEVSFVAEPNCVCEEYPPGTFSNLNAANFLGIKTDIDSFHRDTSKLFGDTLHVMVDLSQMKPFTEEVERQLFGWSAEAVVKATIESVLLTASRNRIGLGEPDGTGAHELVEARYIWVEVLGSEDYAHLGGVFSFEELGPLPRARRFW